MNEDRIDYKLILVKGLKYWYFFPLSLMAALGIAYYLLETTHPQYQASALFLIQDEGDSRQLNQETLFAELGLGKNSKRLENETMVLKSSPLMEEVVRNLKLQFQTRETGGLIDQDLYGRSPVQVLDWQPDNPAPENHWLSATVELKGNNGFLLHLKEQEYPGEFGKPLKLPNGMLTLANSREKSVEGPIAISITPPTVMAKWLTEALQVEMIGEESSILQLNIKNTSPQRAGDILAELMDEYNIHSVEEKNKVYENSIGLINERIQMINEELSDVEQDVASYKSQFNIGELSAEGSMLMSELSDYNRQISGTDVQLEILNSIEEFLDRNREKFDFVPTNLSINNLTLTNQLESFNLLLRERERLRNDLGPSHPDLKLTERQIQNLRLTIVENIQAIKRDLQITRNASQELRNDLETRMRSLPRRERELIEIERRKNVKENLYLYLLQKREESAISMALTVPTGKVVEPAEAKHTPVSPKRAQIWLIAFFMGVAIPAGLILLLETLNDRVQLEDDVEKLTNAPIGGMVGFSRKKERMVVKPDSHSAQAEMFRLLRANLSYIAAGEPIQRLLVTSSMSGEGKSFIAMNLGMTQALTGKKVIILELDLRKPRQEEYLSIDRAEAGVVNYLVDTEVSLQDVIRNTGAHPNFDIITSGPKPPNPSELILSSRLRSMVTELQASYDFIIIDAPPVGLVADALQMKDLAQATMYVVRIDYTRKGQLRIIDDIHQKDKLPRPFLVLNAVKLGTSPYGSNYYGYGYGSYYYEDDRSDKWWKKIFSRKEKTAKKTSSSGKMNGQVKNQNKGKGKPQSKVKL